MTLEEVVVALVVLAAVAFVVRRFAGLAPTKTKAPKPGPDVPVARLVRKKKEPPPPV